MQNFSKPIQSDSNDKNFNHFKINFILNLKAMKSLLKLINADFWQSIFMPFFCFGFVALFIGVYGAISLSQFASSGNQAGLFKSAIIGAIALQVMSIAITSVPQSINDFKSSVLLKRIGSTPIKPWAFLTTFALFYVVVMLISSLWGLLWIVIWFPTQIQAVFGTTTSVAEGFAGINWGGFIIALLYMIIASIFLGLLIVSLTKSAAGASALGMPIFFLSMFLSGQLFPIQYIAASEALNVISYLSPFRYTTGLMIMSWDGANIFDMTTPFILSPQFPVTPATEVYHTYDLWLNWFIPIVFVILSLGLSIKNFKWSSR